MSQPFEVAEAIAYARAHHAHYLADLIAFLRIPSVSTQPEHQPDVEAAAAWLAEQMKTAGLEHVTVYPTAGHPVVYADWLHAGPTAPTVLFYGHYDVQPADDIDLWKSPPFEPTIRKENLYARGASDDKGQIFMLLKAVEAVLQATGRLPVNVKFALEGEEESGSQGLMTFAPGHKDLLAADIVFISDTPMADFDQPALVYGLRGMAQLNLTLTGPKLDVHSGVYGGGINNPINVLARLLAQLQDADGHVLIPGFYDAVRPLSQAEQRLQASFPFDEAEWLRRIDVPLAWGEPAYTLLERVGSRPTLDINGIVGGYTGAGGKTIIPSSAHAKLSMRLAPDQDPETILAQTQAFIRSLTPPHVRLEMQSLGTARAVLADIHHPAVTAASQACEAVFGRPPVYRREGGSLPVVATLQAELGLQPIMLGFGLPHDRIHAPNERFFLPNFYRGLETVIHFLAFYHAGRPTPASGVDTL